MSTLTMPTEWVRKYNPHGAVILAYLAERSKDADEQGWFTATLEDFRADTNMNLQTYTKWRRRFVREGILEDQPRDYKEPARYRLHLD